MTGVDTGTGRALLRDLVETPSVSGEEDDCASRLAEFFESRDRAAWRDEAGNLRAPGDDALLLTSHLDTVPGDIPVEERDGALWGRGSVDAKGSLAAMAVAAVETGASFVGVVQEETDSAGARFLATHRSPPGAVINGEPSGWDAITLGYRGLLEGTYVATSRSGHSSRPEPNAIQDAVAWWSEIESALGGDELQKPFERVTPKPIDIEGGTSEDGLSVEARIRVQFRIPPGRTVEDVREVVEERLSAGTVTWDEPVPPVMESPRTPVASALRRAIRAQGGEPAHLRKTGTSDMNVFADTWDVPMATYGPGDASLDHTPEEHLALEEFDRATRVLTEAADSLLAAQ
ncbi:MAG: [LysW]-lysine hydrolase [Halodesulfurarchaeum sp.]